MGIESANTHNPLRSISCSLLTCKATILIKNNTHTKPNKDTETDFGIEADIIEIIKLVENNIILIIITARNSILPIRVGRLGTNK